MTENNLFSKQKNTSAPLADKMRPKILDEFLGQDEIVGEGHLLRLALEKDSLPSMIFWGPPGCGKTTLAHIIASQTKANFVSFSAVSGSVKEVREIVAKAEKDLQFYHQKTILFVDEIHRFNKAQQDGFLGPVEKGIITLIGATTENPSFTVNAALLSRCRVFGFHALTGQNIADLIVRVLKDKENGLGRFKVKITPDTIKFLASRSGGDARTAYNVLDLIAAQSGSKNTLNVTLDAVKEALQKSHLLYDKDGEEHFNIISALHKSMRGSDADAALYWLGRMLEAGEDPLYIARRIVRFASEDIGLADPQALFQAVAAYQACHFLGVPECNVHLAQAVVYMARAPKSNALYVAYTAIAKEIKTSGSLPVPLHLRNAETKLMKDFGYGEGYQYNPNFKGEVRQDYLPKKLAGRKFIT